METLVVRKSDLNRKCVGIGSAMGTACVASLPDCPDDMSTLPRPPLFPDGVIVDRAANRADAMQAWKAVIGKNDIRDLLNFIRSLKLFTR